MSISPLSAKDTPMPKSALDSLTDSNLSARRAASEAIEVGRAAALDAAQQGERLANADRLADRQSYLLDRTERALRNLTWGGWIANRFSAAPKPPDRSGDRAESKESEAKTRAAVSDAAVRYDPASVPSRFAKAAGAVRDYRCNAILLSECSTDEMRIACSAACDALRDAASGALRDLGNFNMDDDDAVRWYDLLMQDFSDTADLHKLAVANRGGIAGNSDSAPDNRERLGNAPLHVDSKKFSEQEEHLAALSTDLSELSQIGKSLSNQFNRHNEILDSIGEKSDELEDRTRAVQRKANRMSEHVGWKKTPPQFESLVTIRHNDSWLFLTYWEGNTVQLKPYHEDASLWEVWRRQGDIVGFKNRLSQTWLGQNLMGNLACSSSRFRRGEEWEMDGEDGKARQSTRLLCAGANWGSGGWLEVKRNGGESKLVIGSWGAEAGKGAALWSVSGYE